MIEKKDGPNKHDRHLKKFFDDGRAFDDLSRERERMRQRINSFKNKEDIFKKTMDVDYSPIEILTKKYGLKGCFKHMSLGMSQRYHYQDGKIYLVKSTPINRGRKFDIKMELVDLDYSKLEDK